MLQNITIPNNAQAVCDVTPEKQVEVLKRNTSPPSPKDVTQKSSALSATHHYMLTHIAIKYIHF